MSMYRCIYGDKTISKSIFCVINYSDEWMHDTRNSDRLWKIREKPKKKKRRKTFRGSSNQQTLPLGAFRQWVAQTSYFGWPKKWTQSDGGSMAQLLITFNDLHMGRTPSNGIRLKLIKQSHQNEIWIFSFRRHEFLCFWFSCVFILCRCAVAVRKFLFFFSHWLKIYSF